MTAVPESDILAALADGPLTLAELETRLPLGDWVLDRRWLGVTVYRMLDRSGAIRPVGCAVDHSHDGSCVVEVAR